MQKDIYAIYEAYITEDGYSNASVRLPGGMPRGGVTTIANNTSRNIANLPAGMPGVDDTKGNLSPSGALNQDEETKEHKSLNREITKLVHLAKTKKYQDVVMYCKIISKLAEDAYNKDKK